MRPQGGGKEAMAEGYFIGADTAGEFFQRPAIFKLVQKRRPHLQHGVGETELKYPAGN